ncbi:hypothetical protein ACFSX9_16040 [Flavobacterium ardleyense]|uniref:Uncharacterized protein n=1 Tax=Flavobacterium ardleyense TaxID=2038737 RepID=A0ABW5ZCA1_9FLAO
MKIEEKYLEKIKSENIFIDIYTDHYEESFYGFIINYTDNLILIEKYNDDFIYDGISVFQRENITRIKWNGNDINSCLSLVDLSKRNEKIKNLKLENLKNTIEEISARYNYVTLYIEDIDKGMCIIGEIEEIDEETIVINQYGTKSTLDRTFIMISLNDVTKVEAGGVYEENLLNLYKKTTHNNG